MWVEVNYKLVIGSMYGRVQLWEKGLVGVQDFSFDWDIRQGFRYSGELQFSQKVFVWYRLFLLGCMRNC